MDKPKAITEEIIPSADLLKAPTIEGYRKIMGDYWNIFTNSFIYLREYDLGLQAAHILLNLTELYKNELTEKEIRWSRYGLWYFYLKLLDRSDCWDEFMKTWEKLRQDASIKHPHGNRHLLDESYWGYRREIIKRKIDRKKAGKSVRHLMHKSQDELTDEERRRRVEVLKFWFEWSKKWQEWARAMIQKRRTQADVQAQRK